MQPIAGATMTWDFDLEAAGPGLPGALPAGFGRGGFSVAAWIDLPARTRTVIGDVAAWFDPAGRRGFTLGLEHGAPCGSHGNDRTPFFGIDGGTAPAVTDHGRPGDQSIMVCSLASFGGALFAATWEEGPAPRGRVHRLEAGGWSDCGSPWDVNAVTRLAVHDGALWAAVTRLRGGGSGREDSANQKPGGRILRYEGGTDWSDQGQLEGADSVAALVPFDGDLYAIPMYQEGLFRLDAAAIAAAPARWAWCGSPGRRLLALGVHDGALYGAGNDHAQVDHAIALTKAGVVVPARETRGGGGVYRYDGGERWTSRGLQPDTTQLYSIETYGGAMHIGTWPTGLVFRAADLEGDGDARWDRIGRLGDETEIMNLTTYNGMLYGGTLPHAELHRYDGDDAWTKVATFDETPDVLYRRAASMVLHQGRLFVGTLPSAHVFSMQAGAVASAPDSLPAGRHLLVGTWDGATASLAIDGRLVATGANPSLAGAEVAPPEGTPLLAGSGPRARFEGRLARLATWDRALGADEIAGLAVS